jgi:hypothetical protein
MGRFVTVFSQLFSLSAHVDFQRSIKVKQVERYAGGVTRRGVSVAILCCQLGRAKALWEISGGPTYAN